MFPIDDFRLPTHGTLAILQKMKQSVVPSFKDFIKVVQEYNVKQLTYPEDALYAFAGIASSLCPPFKGGFVSGLPVLYFDLALL